MWILWILTTLIHNCIILEVMKLHFKTKHTLPRFITLNHMWDVNHFIYYQELASVIQWKWIAIDMRHNSSTENKGGQLLESWRENDTQKFFCLGFHWRSTVLPETESSNQNFVARDIAFQRTWSILWGFSEWSTTFEEPSWGYICVRTLKALSCHETMSFWIS